jgi:hypothetical protein
VPSRFGISIRAKVLARHDVLGVVDGLTTGRAANDIGGRLGTDKGHEAREAWAEVNAVRDSYDNGKAGGRGVNQAVIAGPDQSTRLGSPSRMIVFVSR